MITLILIILFIIIYSLFINYAFINKEEKFEKKKQYKLKIGFFDPYLNDKELELNLRKKLILKQIKKKMLSDDIIILNVSDTLDMGNELKKDFYIKSNSESIYVSKKHKLSNIKLSENYEMVSFRVSGKKINLIKVYDVTKIKPGLFNKTDINIYLVKNNLNLSDNITKLNTVLPDSYEIDSISKNFYKYNVLENEKDFYNFFILHNENKNIYNSSLFSEDLSNDKAYKLSRLVNVRRGNINIYDMKTKIKTKSLSLYKYINMYITFE